MEKTEDTQLLEQDKPNNRFEPFKPFSWTTHVKPPCPEIDFISQAHDIADGIELDLELIEESWLSRDDRDIVPELHAGQESRLLRLPIASSGLLAERSMEPLSEADDAARKNKQENK